MRLQVRSLALFLMAGMLVLAGCPDRPKPTVQAAETPVRLAYVPWSSSIASAHLVQAVIQEKLGRPCHLEAMNAKEMWQAVAEGRADAMLSAWLPETHAPYLAEFGARLVDLGPNLEGTKVGLAIPNITAGRLTAGTGIRNRPYMTIQSIPELDDHAGKINGRIIGIDPEAGVMRLTRRAMDVYALDRLRLIEGSEVSMVAELSDAIRRQRWVVVTAWLPHWIFARWDLKFLEDPQNVYGSGGAIHTMVRQGLEKDMPKIHALLDRFYWKPEDMGQLMLWNQADDGLFPYEKALRYLRAHPAQVQTWLP